MAQADWDQRKAREKGIREKRERIRLRESDRRKTMTEEEEVAVVVVERDAAFSYG